MLQCLYSFAKKLRKERSHIYKRCPAARALCIFLLGTVLLLSACSSHLHHDCTSADCRICLAIRSCVPLPFLSLRTLILPALCLLSARRAYVLARERACARIGTPVTDKVKLMD